MVVESEANDLGQDGVGGSIWAPSSSTAKKRSILASARQATAIPSRIGTPIQTIASPIPVEIPATRNTKYAVPSGNASTSR